jgi:hypothetical protein
MDQSCNVQVPCKSRKPGLMICPFPNVERGTVKLTTRREAKGISVPTGVSHWHFSFFSEFPSLFSNPWVSHVFNSFYSKVVLLKTSNVWCHENPWQVKERCGWKWICQSWKQCAWWSKMYYVCMVLACLPRDLLICTWCRIPPSGLSTTAFSGKVVIENSVSYMLLLMVPEQMRDWHCCSYSAFMLFLFLGPLFAVLSFLLWNSVAHWRSVNFAFASIFLGWRCSERKNRWFCLFETP